MNKQKIKKITLITGAVLLGLFLIVVVDTVIRTYVVEGKPLPAPTKFITAIPVKLDQIAGISKFRSCQGHDMSGKGSTGIIEGNRSMKHYFAPREELKKRLDVIEIRAPFDGEIVYGQPSQKGREMMIAPDADPNWAVIIFHILPLDGYKSGREVKAGELLGYAHVQGRHDFDIALTHVDGGLLLEKLLQLVRGNPHFMLPKGNYMVSPFDYMTSDVLKEFQTAGFNTSDMQFTQEYRDDHPCDFGKAGMAQDEWQYLPGLGPQTGQPQPGTPSAEQQPAQQTPVLYPGEN